MKVYLEPTTDSRGIMRVRDALIKYAPSNIEIVDTPSECDFAVIHVYGRHDKVQKQIEWFKENHKPYAMVQYAIRSTKNPSTLDWVKMWRDAQVVWSYYDLQALVIEDLGVPANDMNFYHSPLGADPKVFYKRKTKGNRRFVMAACSQDYLVESAREIVLAADRLNKMVFFLGKELNKENVECKTGIDDEILASYYSDCEFVSGLRRIEGFELPAVEGLFCGARPIMFDTPHYRQWFNDFAIFIPEVPREVTIDLLEKIFTIGNAGYPTVTSQEMEIARERFNWNTIIKGFWKKVL